MVLPSAKLVIHKSRDLYARSERLDTLCVRNCLRKCNIIRGKLQNSNHECS